MTPLYSDGLLFSHFSGVVNSSHAVASHRFFTTSSKLIIIGELIVALDCNA